MTVLKGIRMDSDLIKEIDKKAKKENRSFSNMVRTLILRALSK